MHQCKHPFFVGSGRHQQDRLYLLLLAQSVHARDALIQHRGIPGNVEVDQHRGILQVQPDAAGVSRDEDLHRIVLSEAVHQRAPLVRWHSAMQAHRAKPEAPDPLFHHLGHPFPLGEDHGLQATGAAELIQQRLEFIELRRALGLLVHQSGGVTRHTRLLQRGHHAVLLRWRERPAPHDVGDVTGSLDRRIVDLLLGLRHGHIDPLHDPFRQLVPNQTAIAAQHHAGQALAQQGEIAVAEYLAAFVGDVEIDHVAPEWTQDARIDDLHQAVQVFEPVFQRCAGQDECIARADPLDCAGDLGAPVLDALGLVNDQQIGTQFPVDHGQVAHHEFIVDHVETRTPSVLGAAGRHGTLHDLDTSPGESLDLARPLQLQRGGTDDQDPLDAVVTVHPVGCGNGLQGLAQAHVIGQQTPTAPRQEGDTLDLVGMQACPDLRQPATAGPNLFADVDGTHGPYRILGQAPGMAEGVVADLDVLARAREFGKAQEIVR